MTTRTKKEKSVNKTEEVKNKQLSYVIPLNGALDNDNYEFFVIEFNSFIEKHSKQEYEECHIYLTTSGGDPYLSYAIASIINNSGVVDKIKLFLIGDVLSAGADLIVHTDCIKIPVKYCFVGIHSISFSLETRGLQDSKSIDYFIFSYFKELDKKDVELYSDYFELTEEEIKLYEDGKFVFIKYDRLVNILNKRNK